MQRGCGMDDTQNDQGFKRFLGHTDREALSRHQVHTRMDLNVLGVFHSLCVQLYLFNVLFKYCLFALAKKCPSI